jgi:hypothetical protein
MRNQLIWTLCAANVALAAGLWWRAAAPNTAYAQQAPPAAAKRSDILAVPGKVASISADVIFVLDTTSGVLGAIAPNTQGQLESMPGKINLNDLATMATEAQQKNNEKPRRGRN